jgi:hypothetical protein
VSQGWRIWFTGAVFGLVIGFSAAMAIVEQGWYTP